MKGGKSTPNYTNVAGDGDPSFLLTCLRGIVPTYLLLSKVGLAITVNGLSVGCGAVGGDTATTMNI